MASVAMSQESLSGLLLDHALSGKAMARTGLRIVTNSSTGDQTGARSFRMGLHMQW
jgi:hypothetical protein